MFQRAKSYQYILMYSFLFLSCAFSQNDKEITQIITGQCSIKKPQQIFGLIILNTFQFNNCNAPAQTIIDNIKYKDKIQWYVVTDSNVKPEYEYLFLQKHHLDTSKVKIILHNDIVRKTLKSSNNEDVIILWHHNKILIKQPFSKIDYNKIHKIIEKTTGYFSAFKIVEFSNPYLNNFFESCMYVLNDKYLLAVCPSLNLISKYNYETNATVINKFFSCDSNAYLNVSKLLIDPGVYNLNKHIIESDKQVRPFASCSPVRFMHSYSSHHHYLICKLNYLSDTIINNQPAVSVNEVPYILKYDSLLNVSDTIIFDRNYYIIPQTGGISFYDTVFYFIRYSTHTKQYVFSEFILKAKKLFLVKDVWVPEIQEFQVIPELKTTSAGNIFLFHYPKKHSEVLKFNFITQQFEKIMHIKHAFVSYTMFYEIPDNNYIYFIKKRKKFFIERYFTTSKQPQTVMEINGKVFQNKTFASNEKLFASCCTFPFFLPSNRILYLIFQ